MWTETKTNDQFSSTGWIIKSSPVFYLRKYTCTGQLDRVRSAVTCHTNDVSQDVTEKYWMSHPVFVTYVSLSTNGVIHCESYNLQAGLKSPLTGAKRLQSGAKRPVSGRNVHGAKRPGGEMSWWRNIQWRGETLKGQNVPKPFLLFIKRFQIWSRELQTCNFDKCYM